MRIDARVVIDTNVHVSAVLTPDAAPQRVVRHCLSMATILVSQDLLHELDEVLSRPKLARYVEVPKRRAVLSELIERAEAIRIVERVKACRDPKDNMILQLAVNGRASCIVTGDADLLGLNPFRGITIVTPAEFLKQVAAR